MTPFQIVLFFQVLAQRDEGEELNQSVEENDIHVHAHMLKSLFCQIYSIA
jgi:hypothetical protein